MHDVADSRAAGIEELAHDRIDEIAAKEPASRSPCQGRTSLFGGSRDRGKMTNFVGSHGQDHDSMTQSGAVAP